MCGGIVGALALRARSTGQPSAQLSRLLAYNLGRILTYVGLGAAAGALAGAVADRFPVALAQRGAKLFAAACFLGLALYLLGRPGVLAPLERAGARLFRWVQPLGRRYVDGATLAGTMVLGVAWGFLPCGLVYSTLVLAATAGSALRSGLVMLAFGLGTLPALVAAGFASRSIARLARAATLRRVAAGAYLLAALWLTRAAFLPATISESGDPGAPACHEGPAVRSTLPSAGS